MLPFEPEMESMMKARFVEAVTPIYDAKQAARSGNTPGKLRKHVFDFYDGMRMIVSRESSGGDLYLHASVSFHGGFAPRGEDLLRIVIDRVKEMGANLTAGVVHAFESKGGIVHFLFPQGTTNKKTLLQVLPPPCMN